jgi:hypothetical protein
VASDVKITLSADDQATEIVRRLSAAVKQFSAENKKNAQSIDDGAKAANKAATSFSGMASAIASIAAAIGAVRVLGFVKDTIDAADQLGKLALKSGATTEALSVLAVAASTADLSQQDLGNSLKFLARSFTELEQGIPATTEAFTALGLTAKELKGLSLDQVLVKVADAQSKFGDGAGKTAALLKIFGRSGEELIPLLHDLANGGFDAAAKKAAELGLVMGRDTTNAAQDFNDAMTTLRNSAKGLIVQLLPLATALTAMATGITTFVAAHPDFSTFAAGAFVAAAGATALAAGLGVAAIAAAALETALLPVIVGIAAIAIVVGGIAVVAKAFRDAKKEADALATATGAVGKTASGILPQVPLEDAAQKKALRDARLAATKQASKDELLAVQAGLKQREEVESIAFAEGLTSVEQFYAARLAITKQGITAQIAELTRERDALIAAPLAENTDAERVKRTTEIKALNEQIARVEVDGSTQVLSLLEQQKVATRAVADEVRAGSEAVLRAVGDEIGAQQLAIEGTVQKFKEALAKLGTLTQDQIDERGNDFSSVLTSRAAFTQNQTVAERQLNALELAREAIRQRAAQGLISERDATLEIANLERGRLPVLQEAVDRMRFFAEEVGDPALLAAADQLEASFKNIGVTVDESTLKIANLRETLLGAVQSDLSQFLGDTISHVNSLSDAFRQLAVSIVSSFQRVIGDILATKAVESIRGLFEGGAKAAVKAAVKVAPEVAAATATTTAATALTTAATFVAGGAGALTSASIGLDGSAAALGVSSGALTVSATGLSASGGILLTAAAALTAAASALAAAGIATAGLGFASGGYVRGPGTGTSDSIPARLSHGEYVIKATAVKKYGVEFFNALNGARMPTLRRPTVAGLPAFASGGLVTATERTASAGTATISGGIDATISLEEGLVMKQLATRGGVRALAKIVSANPQLFKSALG